jgi:GNAT superfamily N-acetyltransferase
MTIRLMTADDVDYVVALGIEMHEESRYNKFPLDIYKCKMLMYEVVDNPKQYCGYVYVYDGKIEGAIVGYVNEFYFGNELIAQDLGLFVRKNRRGCMAAVNLVKMYEAWAKENHADEIQLGLTTGVDHDRTSKLYEKLGFKASGTVFKKEI